MQETFANLADDTRANEFIKNAKATLPASIRDGTLKRVHLKRRDGIDAQTLPQLVIPLVGNVDFEEADITIRRGLRHAVVEFPC